MQEIAIMLQRIQTIYLLLAFIITGVLPFFFPLWTMNDGKEYVFMQNQIYVVLFGLSTTLTLVSIVSYKKRQNQFVMGRLNIILNLIFFNKKFNMLFLLIISHLNSKLNSWGASFPFNSAIKSIFRKNLVN